MRACAVQLQLARQQVTALNTEAAAPGMAPAPGVTAAGGAQSGVSTSGHAVALC